MGGAVIGWGLDSLAALTGHRTFPLFFLLMLSTVVPIWLITYATEFWHFLVLGLFVGLAGAYTAVKQVRNHYPADFGWTDFFHPAHYLAWTGLALIVTLLVVDRERRR